MSDSAEIPEDEILPEYSLNSGVRGKYAARYAAGTNLDRLQADVTAESPDPNPVNNALRCRLPLSIACAAALLCGACLPITHTRTLSPAIEGTYRNEDGTPVAGAPLALSTAFSDSTCATPSLRTTTAHRPPPSPSSRRALLMRHQRHKLEAQERRQIRGA